MHIKAKENKIVIKPGKKPTHISVKGNHVKVGKEPMEFKIFAVEDKTDKKRRF